MVEKNMKLDLRIIITHAQILNNMNNLIKCTKNSPHPTNIVLNDLNLLIINPEDIVKIFTTRQLEILWAVIEGFTNKEIAEKHYIDESTVKRHRQNIMNKVGISGRDEMRMFIRIIKDFFKSGTKSTTN